MHDRLAIIGASDLQAPLIRKAKELGFQTHVFAWAANDVGERLADRYYPISITEVNRITEICRTIKPVAVTTIASDLAAVTATNIAYALNLPSNPIETTVLAANKFAMRKAFVEAGLPVPKFFKIQEGESLPDISDFCFPVIVKPTDRSGSRGVFKVMDSEKLEQPITLAQRESFERAAIIEEYIEGKEYSVECISKNGKHRRLAITEKYTTGAPRFIETGHIEPAGLNRETEESIDELVFRALDALHIRLGASHTELKITSEGELWLIETGARMGGDCIGSDLVPLTTGYDFLEMVLDAALGNTLKSTPTLLSVPAAAVRYIMNKKDYDDYCFLRKNHSESIVRECIHFEIDKPHDITDSSTRYGFYIVKASSRDKIKYISSLY